MKHFFPADILLPKTDFEKWAVVACDQYTSEPVYWEEVERVVGDSPSALRIILPEIFLSDDNTARVERINQTMQQYLDDGVFEEHKNAMIYVERASNHTCRRGIVGLIDLDDYDYHKNSGALIRATEQTVLERIPPRVQIRRDATLEMPHVLLLIDDPDGTVIEPLSGQKTAFAPAYNFDLMQDGGHIDGYFLSDDAIAAVQQALDRLGSNGLLFAVGDGNHSLATAKECYRQTQNSLARYALVEVVNIHDPSIEFEPIYRVLFHVDPADFIAQFKAYTSENGGEDRQTFCAISGAQKTELHLNAVAKLPVGTLQPFIDRYLSEHPETKVDYIHGEDVVESLCKAPDTLGLLFDGMRKDELFGAIESDGSLPRKTFSMGHAHDKRYYIEARKIR